MVEAAIGDDLPHVRGRAVDREQPVVAELGA